MIGHLCEIVGFLWVGAAVGYFVRGFSNACRASSEMLEDQARNIELAYQAGVEARVRGLA